MTPHWGISLTLDINGDESIFAIDGQHRAVGIRQVVKQSEMLLNEEVPIIFIAHRTDESGIIRTRRLFSTLNRYAVPVNKKEIIILSEDDNCAIVTRDMIEKFSPFNGRIVIHKTRVISPTNRTAFTNIIVLYDIIVRLLTDKKVVGIKVKGHDYKRFTSQRQEEEVISDSKRYVRSLFREIIETIPSFRRFFDEGQVDRTSSSTSLLFRPIGQNILFDVIKVATTKRRKSSALDFFAKDDFNLDNYIWKRVFWDEETNSLSTEKARQRYATLLILENIGVHVERTKKDQQILANFGITADQL